MKKYTLVVDLDDKTFREVALISDDQEGSSIGAFFKDNWHTTYHVDGTFHTKRSVDRQNTFEVKHQPITSIQSSIQISTSLIPLENLISVKNATVKDSERISIKNIKKNVLSVSYFIVNKSEINSHITFLKSLSFLMTNVYSIELASSANHLLQIICSEQDMGEERENIDRSPIKTRIISEGKLKDRKIILSPRNNLNENEWAVENYPSKKAKSSVYSKACLIHEVFIPDNGCLECTKEESNSR